MNSNIAAGDNLSRYIIRIHKDDEMIQRLSVFTLIHSMKHPISIRKYTISENINQLTIGPFSPAMAPFRTHTHTTVSIPISSDLKKKYLHEHLINYLLGYIIMEC